MKQIKENVIKGKIQDIKEVPHFKNKNTMYEIKNITFF